MLEQWQEYLRLLIQSILLHHWHLWQHVWKSSSQACTDLILCASASICQASESRRWSLLLRISLQHLQHPVQSHILSFHNLSN